MDKTKNKITPKDSNFDAADYDVPIEIKAYNEGYNAGREDMERYMDWRMGRLANVKKIESFIKKEFRIEVDVSIGCMTESRQGIDEGGYKGLAQVISKWIKEE